MPKPQPFTRQVIAILVYVPLSAASYYFAYLLRFDFDVDSIHQQIAFSTLPWVVVLKIAAAVQSQLHKDLTRYVTFRDMYSIARTATISTVAIILVDALVVSQFNIPRSVLMLDWGCSVLVLAGTRTLPRVLRDRRWSTLFRQSGTRAIILGANDEGESLLRTIRHCSKLNYHPIGFIDERAQLVGHRIAGLPVLGRHSQLADLVHIHQAEEVLITAGSTSGKSIRKIISSANKHDFRIKVLPSYEQILQERVDIQPRNVVISDLLRRPSVELDDSGIQDWLTGRTVLVTGSSGSIGSEICRQILARGPKKLVVLDRSETGQFFLERELRLLAPEAEVIVTLADLTDRERLAAVFDEHRPDIIFHAAAYKHVPLMESHVGEALKNIVLATTNVTDLAERFAAESMVMISTDKAVNPTSVMGSCKRLAEQYVQSKAGTSKCRLVTVRFGNVLDSAGSVVPVFREQIRRGGPVTVTHPDMVRYFMLIPEAAQLVIQAGEMGEGGEIFVLDMGDPVRILDLAKDMIELSGLRVGEDIEIKISGLRPGEKLFEELYSDNEEHRRTAHEKIMVAACKPRNLLTVIHDINHLSDILNEPNDLVRDALAQIIPLQAPETPQRAPASKAA